MIPDVGYFRIPKLVLLGIIDYQNRTPELLQYLLIGWVINVYTTGGIFYRSNSVGKGRVTVRD